MDDEEDFGGLMVCFCTFCPPFDSDHCIQSVIKSSSKKNKKDKKKEKRGGGGGAEALPRGSNKYLSSRANQARIGRTQARPGGGPRLGSMGSGRGGATPRARWRTWTD